MCGIFGVINGVSVTNSLISGLKSLSYRGYDSAGIAVIGLDGLERRRAKGKLECLVHTLKSSPIEGPVGIAHTRWATHGAPNKRNAHPHMTSRVAVAHNGIIENCQTLRNALQKNGYQFESETDSETIPLLITQYLDQGMSHEQALRNTLASLEGSFAIAAVFGDQPGQLFAARRGSPLILGQANDGYFLASDSNALKKVCNFICHLEDGDLARISRNELVITNPEGEVVTRAMQAVTTKQQNCDKQGYRHYMLKEIYQQPEVITKTFAHYLDPNCAQFKLPALPFNPEQLQRLAIIACGTSYYAGMVAKYWIENMAGLPVDLDIASEYRYRNAPLQKDTASLFISQSGETADTLAALRHSQNTEQSCLSIVNVTDSSIAHESDGILATLAGPEIGVASTKAFTAQLAILFMLTLVTARAKGRLKAAEEERLVEQVHGLPQILTRFLEDDLAVRRVAKKLQHARNALFLGRGIAFPLALEGALKLKEISYIHAEAYPAGELKHGPIALVDNQMPVVVVAPPGALFGKTLSNLREVGSRGAKIVLISNQECVDKAKEFIEDAIVMPQVEELLQPILYSLPLQLLAYHTSVLKGTDVDQPRNLAKSVTVE